MDNRVYGTHSSKMLCHCPLCGGSYCWERSDPGHVLLGHALTAQECELARHLSVFCPKKDEHYLQCRFCGKWFSHWCQLAVHYVRAPWDDYHEMVAFVEDIE